MGQKIVRYAVVGQGYFAQAAILPAFQKARGAQLVALISDDQQKLEGLGKEYDVEHLLHYDDYDRFLRSGAVDAVYIALPNSMHCEFTLRAAAAGVHVLCEKPMGVDESECLRMIAACETARVKLMVGYRLHFDPANLEAIEIAQSGKLGDVRAFNSVFTMQVSEGNSRTRAHLAGGPLNDIGIYCINAARYVFQSEPIEVSALSAARRDDARFAEIDEQMAVILRFPNERLATFFCSFGAADAARYEIIGTKGILRVDPAYEWETALAHELTVEGKTSKKTFPRRDQIAAELVYFSDCIALDRKPEPSGSEGLADMRIIRAIQSSALTRRAVPLSPVDVGDRPTKAQEITVRPHRKPNLVNAAPPTRH